MVLLDFFTPAVRQLESVRSYTERPPETCRRGKKKQKNEPSAVQRAEQI